MTRRSSTAKPVKVCTVHCWPIIRHRLMFGSDFTLYTINKWPFASSVAIANTNKVSISSDTVGCVIIVRSSARIGAPCAWIRLYATWNPNCFFFLIRNRQTPHQGAKCKWNFNLNEFQNVTLIALAQSKTKVKMRLRALRLKLLETKWATSVRNCKSKLTILLCLRMSWCHVHANA